VQGELGKANCELREIRNELKIARQKLQKVTAELKSIGNYRRNVKLAHVLLALFVFSQEWRDWCSVVRQIRCLDHVFCKWHFCIVNNVLIMYSEHCALCFWALYWWCIAKITEKCAAVSIHHIALTI
jgi:hypothetical protein